MDALLINSPLFEEEGLANEDSLPPIGLGLVATALARTGLSVSIVDAAAEGVALGELVERAQLLRPSVIGTNVFTTNYPLVKKFVEAVATFCPHIIVGGLAVRGLHAEILSWECPGQLDVVLGDGERIIVPLVLGKLTEVPIWSQNRKRFFLVDHKSQYWVKDLCESPLDRSLLPTEPVLSSCGVSEAHLVTGRGCIHNCAFCGSARSQNYEMPVRERTVASLRDELASIRSDYPQVGSIRVLDDLFLKNFNSFSRAANVFGGMGFGWRAMAHVSSFNSAKADMLSEIKHNGCSELFVGIESGSDRIRKLIRKTSDVDTVKRNLRLVLSSGIPLKGYFMFGLPGETRDDFERTYRLACDLKTDAERFGVGFRTSVFRFRPYHGTELHRQLMAEGQVLGATTKAIPDEELTAKIGRGHFNFTSGNFSAASDRDLEEYVCKTMSINNHPSL
ncbi:MAG: B12-binding domain-containing radical SAM protein [Coriobacteriia bacterium]